MKINSKFFMFLFFVIFAQYSVFYPCLRADASKNTDHPEPGQSGSSLLEESKTKSDILPAIMPIKFETEPKGALLEIDGKIKVNTPKLVLLKEGRHTIKISMEGYETVNETIDIKGVARRYFYKLQSQKVDPVIVHQAEEKKEDTIIKLVNSGRWDEVVKIGDPAIDTLINALRDADFNKRSGVAEVLGKVKNNKAIIPLFGLLTDDHAEVRKKAIIALGEIGDSRAIEPLRKVATTDNNPDIRSAADDVLKKLSKEALSTEKPHISDKSDKDEIKRILSCINESIQLRDIDKFCQFLSKEDNNFYSSKRKEMEDFINEIQILNSSFDNINISMNEDTANVQYIWNMDFKSKLLGDNVKNNMWMVSMKLKKNGNNWEIFQIKGLSSIASAETSGAEPKSPSMLDTIPPKGSISISNGSAYTNSRIVTLHLSATDNIGVIGYYISSNPTSPSAATSGWKPVPASKNYSENISHTLDSGDGRKTVYVWYKDSAGNISASANDAIILDTTPPTVTITNPTSDATYTTTVETIVLRGTAEDSVSKIGSVQWSNNGGDFKYADGTTNWSTNIKLSQGNNTVTVVAADLAGNTSLDTTTVFYKVSSFTVVNHLMTGITKEDFHNAYKECAIPPQKYTFLDTDRCATQWFYYQNATPGDTITWKWYLPDGRLCLEDKGTIDTDEGCWQSCLNIAGHFGSYNPGQWQVKVYRNGQFLFSDTFTISQPKLAEVPIQPEKKASQADGLHQCATCSKEMGEGHICGLTTYCQQCKEDVGKGHICDLTFFCHDCKKEVGDGHICGVTTFCPKCEEEVGTGHICDVTYFCYDCEKEVGDEHICGVTHFCPTCKAEAGEGHVCGRTYFCFDCEKEMPKEHSHSNPGKKSYKTKPINYFKYEDIHKPLRYDNKQYDKFKLVPIPIPKNLR